MHDFLFTFGLGQHTGIDIQGELGGILPSREWKQRTYRTVWYPGETLITGIGQGFMLTTPLQLANITATLSMYGRRTQPNMIYAIQDTADKDHQLISPRPLEPVPVVQISHWESIINAMQQVVNSLHGTAHRISYRLPYSIAGKTGTAQVFGLKQDEEYKEEEISKKLRDHALFIGFAPVEDPQIAVAVIVENGGHGSSAAAPVVRKVMDQYLVKPVTQ
jgi:penicillin-binding protein 2